MHKLLGHTYIHTYTHTYMYMNIRTHDFSNRIVTSDVESNNV